MTVRLPKYIGTSGTWLLAFVLFHPDVLTVTALDGQALHLSTAEVVRGPLRLQLDGDLVRCGSQNVSVCAVEEREGGHSDFVLAIPGKIKRRFRGTLEVRVSNGRLLPVVRMDLETA